MQPKCHLIKTLSNDSLSVKFRQYKTPNNNHVSYFMQKVQCLDAEPAITNSILKMLQMVLTLRCRQSNALYLSPMRTLLQLPCICYLESKFENSC